MKNRLAGIVAGLFLIACRPRPEAVFAYQPGPASAGRLSIAISFDGPFAWTVDAGRMRVTAPRVPACSLFIQARRGPVTAASVVGFGIADFRGSVSPSMVDVAVLPFPGEKFQAGDYPVILLESCGSPSKEGGG